MSQAHHLPSISSRWLRLLVIFFSALMLSACGTSPKPRPAIASSPAHPQALQSLYQQHQQWEGTPYRYGGQSRSGVDCSGFVQLTFSDLFGISLPRTTSQQVHAGQQINKSDLETGDLVFFRHGRHVGIYLEDDKFLHASTRLGVTISDMNNIYWSRKYWRSIRVQSEINDR